MNRKLHLHAILPALLLTGIASADYPIMNMVADNVIDKYQNASCEALWEEKGKPKSDRAKEAIQLLKDNPQMRTEFIDKVAAPVVNKMFECGMIP